MPLRKIPKVVSPDLLHALCSMGHGDEIGVWLSANTERMEFVTFTDWTLVKPHQKQKIWIHCGDKMGPEKVLGFRIRCQTMRS